MSFDYSAVLIVLRDARKKRGKTFLTKKFFDTLRVVNSALPLSISQLVLTHPYEAIPDHKYSNDLLELHVSLDIRRGRVAKTVTGNGNCLFNSASIALVGKCSFNDF